MKKKSLICITLAAVSLGDILRADSAMDVAERVTHCKSLANLAYLAAKKVKTGRKLTEIKKELSSVSKAASTTTNGGMYSDLFLSDYTELLQDTYSIKPKYAKEYALEYRSNCIGKKNH